MTNEDFIAELRKIELDETYSPYVLIRELKEKIKAEVNEGEDNTL